MDKAKATATATTPTAATASETRVSLLVCIPAHNEAENIYSTLTDLLALPMRDDFDVLIIDDGSTDATRSICESFGVRVVTHIYNMGYGAALKTAYKYATDHCYGYVIQMDADGQHDPANVPKLYEGLTTVSGRRSAPDILIGSRFLDGSITFRIPFYKKFVIVLFNLIIHIMTKGKITDPTSGLQGLNRKAFSFYAQFNRFATDFPDANMIIQMELNDFKIRETPAIMHPRVHGESMHRGLFKPMKYIIKMTLSMFVIYIRESAEVRKRRRGK